MLAILGSHHLILDAIEEYEINSVSMVVESLRPSDQTEFVSVALCEMGHTKQSYKNLDEIMKQLSASDTMAIISLIQLGRLLFIEKEILIQKMSLRNASS